MAVFKLQKDAAKDLGVTPAAVVQWEKIPGFPDCSAGYDTDAIRAWRDANNKKGSETDVNAVKLNELIKYEKLKEIRNRNLLLQMEIDAKNRVLVPVDVVREVLMECAGLIRGLGRQLQQKGNLQAAEMVEAQMDRLKKSVAEKLGK